MAKILIADDDKSFRSFVIKVLLEEEHQILEAHNGKQVLALCRQHTPDLILLDAIMPEMNGWMTAARLKADPKTCHIPIVGITSLEDTFDNKFDYFMQKPVYPGNIISMVHKLIDPKNQLDELEKILIGSKAA